WAHNNIGNRAAVAKRPSQFQLLRFRLTGTQSRVSLLLAPTFVGRKEVESVLGDGRGGVSCLHIKLPSSRLCSAPTGTHSSACNSELASVMWEALRKP